MNIENQVDQAESQNDGTLLDLYNSDDMKTAMYDKAKEQAESHIKKHQKEIDRLNTHVENCLFDDNFAGYSYGIKKLRDIYKQPYNDELIVKLWDFSRNELVKLIAKAQQELK